MTFPTKEELSREVIVTADTTARWGGVDYDLTTPTRLQYGVVYHWKETIQGVEFDVTDAVAPAAESRDVVNPFEDSDKGEAFAGLKRPRKPKADEEG